MSYTGSKARAGRGTIFTIGGITGATGTPTFLTVGETMKASFSGASWATVDVTNFDSNVDDEFITTTRNNGELSVEYNMVDGDTGQVSLEAAYDVGSKYDFKVQLKPGVGQTVGKLYTFSGLVMSLETPVETRSAVTGSVKIKISGPIVRTAGS